jgi:hypothetical protein
MNETPHTNAERLADIEARSWLHLKLATLPDLIEVESGDLVRLHRHVRRQVARAGGVDRMIIAIRLLNPIQLEVRYRRIPAVLWSPRLRLAGDLGLTLRHLAQAPDPVAADDLERAAARLRRQMAAAIRDEARERHRRRHGRRVSLSRRR